MKDKEGRKRNQRLHAELRWLACRIVSRNQKIEKERKEGKENQGRSMIPGAWLHYCDGHKHISGVSGDAEV
jgi:hypothetical protein